jgi:signal transduction histidine kinase/ligand-binding sensor domain-containing protein
MTQTRILLAGILLAAPGAFALNPALDINQYAHTAWRNSDGFSRGVINAIAQTPDGYLWFGTEFGLLRFDGVRPVAWAPPGEQLPSEDIRNLLVTRDGNLWIGTAKGLVSWKDGRLTRYAEFKDRRVSAFFQSGDGTLWAGEAGTSPVRLCAIRNGSVRCYGEDGGFSTGVSSICEYGGSLWAAGGPDLWRWRPDPPKRYPLPDSLLFSITDVIEGDNGLLWIATYGGIRQLVGDRVEPQPIPAGGRFIPYKMLRDREGGVWIGTRGQGLVHVHQGKTDVFTSADGLSDDTILRMFEDREGNIWAATTEGLDRFRDFAIPTISFKQGLSGSVVMAVLAARDGGMWLGTPDGLDKWKDGQITIYRAAGRRVLRRAAEQPAAHQVTDDALPDNSVQSLFRDDRGRIWIATLHGLAYFEDGRFTRVSSVQSTIVHSIGEGSAGNIWISDLNLGLLHLLDGRLTERISLESLGPKGFVHALIPDRNQGGLWLGFLRDGLAYFKDGQLRASYTTRDGLGEGWVNELRLDADGTLWAATEGGLSRLKDGRITTLTSRNGLPCDGAHWSKEDDAHSLWLYSPCGLISIARPELDAWAADPHHTVKALIFDNSDGVKSFAHAYGLSPRVAKATDGKLWFVSLPGVAVVDPLHLPINRLPPPVHIEKITADRTEHDLTSDMNGRLRLPPLVRDLVVEYTALSFVAPEKVRFRYKLEGQDPEWKETTDRKATYSNLGPRRYQFRVMACNNSGLWNEAGAAFEFSIDPKWYQTRLFQVACVAAVLGMLWGAHRLRMNYLAGQFNLRLEERVNERTRIARELHDTMLQSFQAALLKFGAVTYALPDQSEGKTMLEAALDQARAAVTEGRDAVQGLRSSTVVANDLARAIGEQGEELRADQTGGNAAEFSVRVDGESRDLPPLVRDEVHRIACEALRNAFRHSGAKRIEVAIHYDKRQFRVRVRDNGKGIDPAVLGTGGRAGHHGLPGMQERAKLVEGKLVLWSELGSGTEVELTIPASLAYRKTATATPSASEKGAS